MTDGRSHRSVLDRIDAYCDAVPRSAATVEVVGSFTVFLGTGAWSYYVRPTRGMQPVAADLVAALRRQADAGQVPSLEWIEERRSTRSPLAACASAAGLEVALQPLMLFARLAPPTPAAPPGSSPDLRMVDADEDGLAAMLAVQSIGFGAGGTDVRPEIANELDDAAAAKSVEELELVRRRIRGGHSALAVAEDDEHRPLSVGMHQPVGVVSEIVGIATLPFARRRGLGGAVARFLAEDAMSRGAEVVFLSAASGEVQQIYERVGFVVIGHAGVASVRE